MSDETTKPAISEVNTTGVSTGDAPSHAEVDQAIKMQAELKDLSATTAESVSDVIGEAAVPADTGIVEQPELTDEQVEALNAAQAAKDAETAENKAKLEDLYANVDTKWGELTAKFPEYENKLAKLWEHFQALIKRAEAAGEQININELDIKRVLVLAEDLLGERLTTLLLNINGVNFISNLHNVLENGPDFLSTHESLFDKLKGLMVAAGSLVGGLGQVFHRIFKIAKEHELSDTTVQQALTEAGHHIENNVQQKVQHEIHQAVATTKAMAIGVLEQADHVEQAKTAIASIATSQVLATQFQAGVRQVSPADAAAAMEAVQAAQRAAQAGGQPAANDVGEAAASTDAPAAPQAAADDTK